MAELKVDVMRAGAIAGALTACGTIGVVAVWALDWRINYVIDQREMEKTRQSVCDLEPTGDEVEDTKLAQLQASIGGCS